MTEIAALTANLAAMLPAAALRSGIVILLAWAIVCLMARRSAAERHLVWVLALAAVLAIPFLGAVLPRFTVPVASPSAIEAVTRALQGVPDIQAATPATGADAPMPGAAPGAGSDAASGAGTAQNTASTAAATDVAATPAPQQPISPTAALLALWLSGATILLLR